MLGRTGAKEMCELIEYAEKFTSVCRRNLEGMFGISSDIAVPAQEKKTIETGKNLIVSLVFTGTVFGEFILAVNEATAAKFLDISDPITDENRDEIREEVCDAMTELLNTIVGEAIIPIQTQFPKLTLTAPRVLFGSIRYPQVKTTKSVLSTTAGEIECHLFVDLMRLSVADSYDEAVNSLKYANVLLEEANVSLMKEVEVHRKTQKERDSSLQQLVAASHLAGMAEVATGVLHNVGNILNSINLSAAIISKQFRTSAFTNLEKVSGLISDHKTNFADFVIEDNRGQMIPEYILGVTDALSKERVQIS